MWIWGRRRGSGTSRRSKCPNRVSYIGRCCRWRQIMVRMPPNVMMSRSLHNHIILGSIIRCSTSSSCRRRRRRRRKVPADIARRPFNRRCRAIIVVPVRTIMTFYPSNIQRRSWSSRGSIRRYTTVSFHENDRDTRRGLRLCVLVFCATGRHDCFKEYRYTTMERKR